MISENKYCHTFLTTIPIIPFHFPVCLFLEPNLQSRGGLAVYLKCRIEDNVVILLFKNQIVSIGDVYSNSG